MILQGKSGDSLLLLLLLIIYNNFPLHFLHIKSKPTTKLAKNEKKNLWKKKERVINHLYIQKTTLAMPMTMLTDYVTSI